MRKQINGQAIENNFDLIFKILLCQDKKITKLEKQLKGGIENDKRKRTKLCKCV